jgi:flagellar hook assembly protein FlgD
MILEQNYPNPFNSQTRISYELDQHGPVRLSIFDGNGRLIRNLVDSDESAGSKYVIWDGMDVQGNQVASGIYLYRLKTLAGMEIKKMILQK